MTALSWNAVSQLGNIDPRRMPRKFIISGHTALGLMPHTVPVRSTPYYQALFMEQKLAM